MSISTRVAGSALGALIVATTTVAFAVPAFASSPVMPTGSTSASTMPGSASTMPGKSLASIQAAGAAAITMRQAQLAKLGTEMATAPSCDTNGVIASEISADGPALTALGQKLAGDITAQAAKADFGTIFTTYRVYLVVTPQAYVTAACGHIQAASAKLTADQQKLASRVAGLPAGPAQIAAGASLADMTTQMTNATAQANSAAASLAGIVPDLGNKTVEAANATAVQGAHSHLVTARGALLAAVNDAKAVVADLKAAA